MGRWLRIVGLAAASLAMSASALADPGRAARWDEDLRTARDVFLAKDRSYSPAARARAVAELERARAKLDSLSDQEITAALARAAALSDNAHTRAYLLRNRGYWRRYPVRIWRFADGWRVVAARDGAEGLVGGRLTHVAGVPVDRAARSVRPLFAGIEGWADYMATYSLTSPDALIGVGLLKGDGATDFTVATSRGPLTLRVQPSPFQPRGGPEESWWFLSPAHPATAGWRHVLAERPLSVALAGAATPYRFLRCADGVAYLQYNRSADAPEGESVRAFGERVMADITAAPPRRLLVDLRFNTGGDLGKARPLMEALAASPLATGDGRLQVLVGPTTFSAGITAAAWLRDKARAPLVGEHPGDVPDFWAEGGNVVLPNSGVHMHYADGLHQYSAVPLPPGAKEHIALGIDVRDLAPDRRATWSWADYLAGRDAVAEAAAGVTLRCPG